MIYIELDNKNCVIYWQDFSGIWDLFSDEQKEELLKVGYIVDSVPEYSGEVPAGKVPQLCYDGGNFYWEMADAPAAPADPEDRVAELENQVTDLQMALCDVYEMMV